MLKSGIADVFTCKFDYSNVKREEAVPDSLYSFDDSYRRIPAPHPPRLYNLEDEPLERHDVSKDYPEITESLSKEFNRCFDHVMKDYHTAVSILQNSPNTL